VLRALHVVPLALASLTLACSEAADPSGEEDFETYRLGRVHVVVDGDVAITARFAFVRGFEEGFVRARIDMPEPLTTLLDADQCVPESALVAPTEHLEDAFDGRELVLADAGPLEIELGGDRIDLPLALVPDLLPYMSGVEYLYVGEAAPAPEAAPFMLRSRGSTAEGLPEFEVEAEFPAALELALGNAASGGIPLRWNTASQRGTVSVRVSARSLGATGGESILCLLGDTGAAVLSLEELRTLGLSPDADELRIEFSRTELSHFTAGDFSGTELLLERKANLAVRLR